ncbi:MAG TPA: type II secretion system F family protein [Thermomicrobiaceae bacterium]|nr:type II secretion system F family protein [Thermomicrobiaceae bacterium]
MGSLMPLLIIAIMVIALAFVVLGLRRPGPQIVIEERLAQFGQRVPTLEEMELQQPFQDRVLVPILRRVAFAFSRFTPKQNTERLRQRLVEAGSPSNLGPTEFTGVRVLLAVGLGGGLLLLFLIAHTSMTLTLLLPMLTAMVGYILPGSWLGTRIKRRKAEITRALPDAIDLLTISVEAGLGFDPALGRVIEKWDNALTREFSRMQSEIRMGHSRREAMRDMAQRVNVDDLNVFISAIVQADTLGVSISQVLRVQSKQMRQARRQRAEEQAHKAPIKMIFPMVFLIFPALYIVLLGPAAPLVWNAFHH